MSECCMLMEYDETTPVVENRPVLRKSKRVSHVLDGEDSMHSVTHGCPPYPSCPPSPTRTSMCRLPPMDDDTEMTRPRKMQRRSKGVSKGRKVHMAPGVKKHDGLSFYRQMFQDVFVSYLSRDGSFEKCLNYLRIDQSSAQIMHDMMNNFVVRLTASPTHSAVLLLQGGGQNIVHSIRKWPFTKEWNIANLLFQLRGVLSTDLS